MSLYPGAAYIRRAYKWDLTVASLNGLNTHTPRLGVEDTYDVSQKT